MKSFEPIRRYFSVLGIDSLQLNQKSAFNVKNVFVLLQLILTASSSFAFILLKAQTFAEYAYGFCMVLTLIIGNFDSLICIWKSEQLFKLMNNFETIIAESNFNLIVYHENTNV